MIDPAGFLLTDLYQLNMVQAYLDRGMTDTAVFELFFRRLPDNRGFLVAAGLDQALDYLENLRVHDHELAWLRTCGRFRDDLIGYCQSFRFTGSVDAMPEGTVFFADEPILRVIAPLPEAQLVETRLINLVHFQTLIAAKAARMVLAAAGKTLVDFGLRRAHGSEAGLLAARASYIAGFAGTATVAAEPGFGIPIFGTMAHSFVQAHDDERAAFVNFARARPDNLTLLIDTYDTEQGARNVVALAPALKQEGISISAVRLDSGDMIALSRRVRAILDAGGLDSVRIFASGGLDETAIAAMVKAEAPIDGFGVGTSLATSSDQPALDCAYKLQEYRGLARRKRSIGKATWPGRKQVWRRHDDQRAMAGDVLGLSDERHAGESLLEPVMRAGKRLSPAPALAAIRERAAGQRACLPTALRMLAPGAGYEVTLSDALVALATAVDRRDAETAARVFRR